MFWKVKSDKSSGNKLPGPKPIVEKVGRSLIVEKGQGPDWVWQLQTVTCPHETDSKKVKFRVFDPAKVMSANIKVENYLTFDSHPEHILWEGWYYKDDFRINYADKEQ